MCNMNRCGCNCQCHNCGTATFNSNICRDNCGNIWVRVANTNETMGPWNGGCGCGCQTNCNNGNSVAQWGGAMCIDGNAYYARQYGLTGYSRQTTCGCGN